MEGNLGLGSILLWLQITVKNGPMKPFTAYPGDFVGVP